MRIGLFALPGPGAGLGQLVRQIEQAEANGLASAWLANIAGADALTRAWRSLSLGDVSASAWPQFMQKRASGVTGCSQRGHVIPTCSTDMTSCYAWRRAIPRSIWMARLLTLRADARLFAATTQQHVAEASPRLRYS